MNKDLTTKQSLILLIVLIISSIGTYLCVYGGYNWIIITLIPMLPTLSFWQSGLLFFTFNLMKPNFEYEAVKESVSKSNDFEKVISICMRPWWSLIILYLISIFII